MTVSRRAFSLMLASLAAWLHGGPAFARPSRAVPLSLFAEPPAALGALCLCALPGQDARQLTDAILGSCGGQTREALRLGIAAQVREDFAAGATVDVDGWQLSLTEARLCALAALGLQDTGTA